MNREQNTFEKSRTGFTLVELLIVIAIIAVLSTLTLVVLRDAQETARHARSASIAAQCRTALQQKLETYETRTLPFAIYQMLAIPTPLVAHQQHLRRRTVMEWVHSEMPHRWEFVDPLMVPSNYSRTVVSALNPASAWEWPATWKDNFVAHFTSRPTSGFLAMLRARAIGLTSPNGSASPANEQAELLYAILQNTWINESRGTDFLGVSEIADTELIKDYCLEVVDAWGEPLEFFIWVDSNQSGNFDLGEELVLSAAPSPADGSPSPPELKDIHVFVDYRRAKELNHQGANPY